MTREEIGILLGRFLVASLTGLAVYLGASWILWDANPSHWSGLSRAAAIILAVVIWVRPNQ